MRLVHHNVLYTYTISTQIPRVASKNSSRAMSMPLQVHQSQQSTWDWACHCHAYHGDAFLLHSDMNVPRSGGYPKMIISIGKMTKNDWILRYPSISSNNWKSRGREVQHYPHPSQKKRLVVRQCLVGSIPVPGKLDTVCCFSKLS